MMVECPKCHELNGENRDTCWKCRSYLPKKGVEHVCPSCGRTCRGAVVTCPDCGAYLIEKKPIKNRESDRPQTAPASDNPKWMYAVAVLLPLIGIILGCIYISKDERDFGQSLIKVSVIVFVVCAVIAGIAAGCAISEANRIMSSLQ